MASWHEKQSTNKNNIRVLIIKTTHTHTRLLSVSLRSTYERLAFLFLQTIFLLLLLVFFRAAFIYFRSQCVFVYYSFEFLTVSVSVFIVALWYNYFRKFPHIYPTRQILMHRIQNFMLIVGDFRAEKKASSGKEIFYCFPFSDFHTKQNETKRNHIWCAKEEQSMCVRRYLAW